ncbi:MAG: glycoside hydrolase family 5 [Tardiphaga sp.]|nr:glycoside hydrolase family 5 [Tardiphaga sp.]
MITLLHKAARGALVLLALHLAGFAAPAGANEDRAHAFARKMARGINILGYDGIWDGGTDAPFRLDNLRLIRKAGFSHVRINLFAFKYMDPTWAVSPSVLNALDLVVRRSIANGLIPIIDEHDGDACEQDVIACREKLVTFWRQTARRYRDVPELAFEILNEPSGRMTHEQWFGIAQAVLQAIREIDSDRIVIVAALNTDEPQAMTAVPLPPGDRNIVLTAHYYRPFAFTHQRAPWIPDQDPTSVSWGSASDLQDLDTDFAAIARWAGDRPVYLGEFGVYDRTALRDRVTYLSAVARAAERHGFAWASWQFDHDFAIFDTDRGAWNKQLLKALIPRP